MRVRRDEDARAWTACDAMLRRYALFSFLAQLQFWMPVWVLYLQVQRGLSLTQITLLDAPFWLIVVLAEVPTGAVADRWGRKTSLLLGTALSSVGMLLFGLASNYLILMLSYLAWGVSITLISGADSAFLYETLTAAKRGGEFRKWAGRVQALAMLAGAVGMLVGAPLAGMTSLSFPILLSAVINLLGLVVGLGFREPVHHTARPRLAYRQVVSQAVRYTVHHPSVRAMIGVRAVLLTSGMMGVIFVQPFLRVAGVAVENVGWYQTPLRLFSVLGALVTYRAAARFGDRGALMALALISTGALLTVGTTSAVWAVVMFGGLSFVNASAMLVTGEYLNHRAPDHLRATVLSVAQMAVSLVLIMVEPLLGVLADRNSLQTMFLVYSVGSGIAITIALLLWSRAHAQESLHPTAEPATEPLAVA